MVRHSRFEWRKPHDPSPVPETGGLTIDRCSGYPPTQVAYVETPDVEGRNGDGPPEEDPDVKAFKKDIEFLQVGGLRVRDREPASRRPPCGDAVHSGPGSAQSG